jgi:class 3 adenylate cyclase
MPEERKLVSILFADVADSTALGDALDPENVRALMSRYYDHARRIIPAYGGTLEKFIGDAVMAIFGFSQAHGDDAERALAAALALRAAIGADPVLRDRFRLRIGVNTGEVVATSNPESHDFLITGDAVNVAARLQQGAQPNEILASERTRFAARAAFLFDDARDLLAKGKPQPLRVFSLKSARAIRLTEQTPFVGRTQDLLQLHVVAARTLEEQRPHLVSIVAPAGTGKTRLLEEFLRRLVPDAGFQVAFARCVPYGQSLTYWPLRGLLSDLLVGDPDHVRLSAVFSKAGYQAEDAGRLSEQILATLGIEANGSAERSIDRESLFASWRLLIEALAQEAPGVIVFEDLHWASESLLDLVEHLTNLRTRAALLLLSLSRPELLDRRPGWGGGRQNFTALALQPLGEAQTRELLGSMPLDLPEAVRQHLVERSGGNPFFALELIRGYAELGLVGEAPSLASLPDTVHAAVLARIDLLSQEEREILQVASVASGAFTSEVLRGLLGEEHAQRLAEALDDLLARDLLVRPVGESYAFRHILIRDVAYGTLSRAERIRLHSKLANVLEVRAAEHLDEQVEMIAHHYREAVRLVRESAVPLAQPFKNEDAAYIFERAGLLAGRAGAYAEANSNFLLALEFAPPSEHARLNEERGDSVMWGSTPYEAYSTAVECWRAAEESDPALGCRLIRKVLFSATRAASIALHVRVSDMAALRAEGLRLAERAGATGEHWRIQVSECFDPTFWSFSHRKLLHTAFPRLRQIALDATVYFEQRQDWAAMNEALDGAAQSAIYMRRWQEGLELVNRRLAFPDLPPDEWADLVLWRAMAHFWVSDYTSCIDVLHDAISSLRPGHSLAHLGGIVSWLASTCFVVGRWDEVIGLLPRLQEISDLVHYDQSGAARLLEGYHAVLWIALAREDQPMIDALATVVQTNAPLLGATFQGYIEALLTNELEKIPLLLEAEAKRDFVLIMLCQFFNERGNPNFHELLQVMRDADMPKSALQDLSEIFLALQENDNGRLARAIEDAEAHQLLPHAARMRIVLAQRTGDPAPLQLARPVLERLGDRQFLRRLEEVEESLHSP